MGKPTAFSFLPGQETVKFEDGHRLVGLSHSGLGPRRPDRALIKTAPAQHTLHQYSP